MDIYSEYKVLYAMLIKAIGDNYSVSFLDLHSENCPKDVEKFYVQALRVLANKLASVRGVNLEEIQNIHKRLLMEMEVSLRKDFMRFANGKNASWLTKEQNEFYRSKINELKLQNERRCNDGGQ